MYICPNCQNASETPINFCSKCGTPMVEKAPEPAAAYTAPAPEMPAPEVPAPPVYTAPAPTAQAPVYTAPQPVSIAYEPEKKAPLGKAIAGMIMSIEGLPVAIISLLATIAEMDIDGSVAFGMAIIYGGFFGFPLSLVGLILSKGYANAGGKSGMAKAGKILGIIGIVFSAISLVLGFLAATTY